MPDVSKTIAEMIANARLKSTPVVQSEVIHLGQPEVVKMPAPDFSFLAHKITPAAEMNIPTGGGGGRGVVRYRTIKQAAPPAEQPAPQPLIDPALQAELAIKEYLDTRTAQELEEMWNRARETMLAYRDQPEMWERIQSQPPTQVMLRKLWEAGYPVVADPTGTRFSLPPITPETEFRGRAEPTLGALTGAYGEDIERRLKEFHLQLPETVEKRERMKRAEIERKRAELELEALPEERELEKRRIEAEIEAQKALAEGRRAAAQPDVAKELKEAIRTTLDIDKSYYNALKNLKDRFKYEPLSLPEKKTEYLNELANITLTHVARARDLLGDPSHSTPMVRNFAAETDRVLFSDVPEKMTDEEWLMRGNQLGTLLTLLKEGQVPFNDYTYDYIKKWAINLGITTGEQLRMLMRRYGWTDEEIDAFAAQAAGRR